MDDIRAEGLSEDEAGEGIEELVGPIEGDLFWTADVELVEEDVLD